MTVVHRSIETGAVMARAVGINHVALEVGDVEAALEWYGRFLDLELRGRTERSAFLDMGDQFLALSRSDDDSRDRKRHFGLVVDDREQVRRTLIAMGEDVQHDGALDVLDPWGNHVQVVDYRDVQFTKVQPVLEGMQLGSLHKREGARAELREKGMLA